MANVRGKAIDNTHLSIDVAEDRGFVHRDYIAHCHRWSHVVKFLGQGHRFKTSRILDIGCGKDVPLAKSLYSQKFVVEQYVGVDYNKKLNLDPFHSGRFPIAAFGEIDFSNDVYVSEDGELVVASKQGAKTFDIPNIFTCFEVIEHVEPAHARLMLENVHSIMEERYEYDVANGNDEPGGHFFLSTPCYDSVVGAAGNHVSEISRLALGALLEDIGFEIVGNYGTFASIRDYEDVLRKDGHGPLFDNLRKYYDVNLLATIFAPLYPQYARNNLWHLRYVGGDQARAERKFKALAETPGPWTSSEKWKELQA